MTTFLTFAAGFVAFPVLLVAWAVLWDRRPETWASRRVFRGLEGWTVGVVAPRPDPVRGRTATVSIALGRVRVVGEQDFTFRGDNAEEITTFCTSPGVGVRAWRGGRTHDKRTVSDCIVARALGFHLRASCSYPNPNEDEIADHDERKAAEWKATVDAIMGRT